MEGLVLSGEAIAVPLTETVGSIAGAIPAVAVRTLILVISVLMMRDVNRTAHA